MGKRPKGNNHGIATFCERMACMKRYILTGTPGAGKASILHELKSQGYCVVEEAATDVIALEQRRGNLEPHLRPDFIDAFVRLHNQRQVEPAIAPPRPHS